jgi:hypothetical protein
MAEGVDLEKELSCSVSATFLSLRLVSRGCGEDGGGAEKR